MEELLDLEFGSDDIAVIRMTNGENRFRSSTIREWQRALDKVLENTSVIGLLITGSGKFFSNGIDLAWRSKQSRDSDQEYLSSLDALTERIMIFPVPTVALINGHAFGFGAVLALACDYRLMRPDRGWLCWPETALGMRFGEDRITMILLWRKIPVAALRDAIFYSKRMTGQVARSLGLVDDVKEDSKMADAGKALVQSAVGRNKLGRQIFQQMKKDLYLSDAVSKL